ncbi:DUF1800 family protein [Flavobacterium maritimum]|uniref:DUF1800 family protein n=1 Tax=Flavobacterium maritimum TaxID=3149042 RepID=UPI0032B4E4D3
MASLNPNTTVLGTKNAKHLLRRATFVYNKALIAQYATLTANQALNLLLADNPLTLNLPYDPLPTTSPDGFWTESTNLATSFLDQNRKASNVAGWWWYNAINSSTLKFKLSHFLSTRFTVIRDTDVSGSATEFYDYVRLLLFYSYGNYKTLAKKMTLNNSMLCFLNNSSNVKNSPNENYAREFLELFTIGKGPQIAAGNYTNYTESDIVQTARVLTGFKRKYERSIIDAETGIPKGYNQFSDHNTSPKTFSSAFNNQIITSASDAASMDTELDNFIEMVFNQQATAKNICRKIYTYFVKSTISTEVENDIITPLAQDLHNNNYEIVPIIRKLLESQHFYDLDDSDSGDETIGGIIKSPIQQLSEICTFLQAAIPDPNSDPLNFYNVFWWNFVNNIFCRLSNMVLFNPENVAGHAAYYQAPDFDKAWISSSTLIAKYRLGESLLDGVNRIYGNTNIAAKISISEVLKNSTIVSNPSDPFILTSELCNALFAQETDNERINYFMNSFLLQDFTSPYWTDAWNSYIRTNTNTVVESRLKLLITKILRAPESQMF